MTDSHLMDADCVHGVVWYECIDCEADDLDLLKAIEQAEAEDI